MYVINTENSGLKDYRTMLIGNRHRQTDDLRPKSRERKKKQHKLKVYVLISLIGQSNEVAFELALSKNWSINGHG